MDIADMHEVARKLYNSNGNDVGQMVLDARSKERFYAEVPEPRPGLRGGSIKNSINVPATILVNADGTMKSAEELLAIFSERKVNLNSELICSCGSGVTACIVNLGLKLIGAGNTRIYDGSWSEYGSVAEPDFSKK